MFSPRKSSVQVRAQVFYCELMQSVNVMCTDERTLMKLQ